MLISNYPEEAEPGNRFSNDVPVTIMNVQNTVISITFKYIFRGLEAE